MLNIVMEVVMCNLARPADRESRWLWVWPEQDQPGFVSYHNRIRNVTVEIGTNTWRVWSLHKAAGAYKIFTNLTLSSLHSWGIFNTTLHRRHLLSSWYFKQVFWRRFREYNPRQIKNRKCVLSPGLPTCQQTEPELSSKIWENTSQ